MKRILVLSLALILAVTTFTGVIMAQSNSAESKYVVVFKENQFPANYQEIIEQAGGKVSKALPQVGAVEAASSDSQFILNVKKNSGVQYTGAQNKLYPEKVVFRSEALNAVEGASKELYDAYQWDIKRVTNDGDSWTLPNGTGLSVDGKDIVVAVVDTGIDYNHPDLQANYLYGKSFVPGYSDPGDDNGHGTHVAGNIAANGLVMGVGPDLKIASYRVFGPTGEASTSQVAEAIIAAADDQVDVMNLSLSGFAWYQDPSSATKDVVADVQVFNRAIQYAINKGVTVVAAAGNSGINVTSPGQTTKQLLGEDATGAIKLIPGGKRVITVSATNDQDKLAFYSNYGASIVDVTAPGGDLGPEFLQDFDFSKADLTKASFSTFPGGGYNWAIGTSQATPKVSAIAGLIIARHGKGSLTPEQVNHLLQQSAQSLGNQKQFGKGIVNAVNALQH